MVEFLTRRRLLGLGGAAMSLPPMAGAAPKRPGSDVPPLPGLYPGRVIAVQHQNSLVQGVFQQEPIQKMFETGMTRLAGARSTAAVWSRLFRPDDVVGIKIVPNGAPHVCSSKEVVNEIIRGLHVMAGVPLSNIVVYDRYGDELKAAGIPNWLPQGVRIAWASDTYTNDQTVISGTDATGVNHYYDSDQWFEVSLAGEQSTRSNASLFLSKWVTKIVNLACLKDHGAAGVTLCLKNLSHGLFNNVNRTHPGTSTYINSFIPKAVTHSLVRAKVVLNIIDGIRGIYNGGPFSTGGREKYLWEHKTLYFATDAVAADAIAWREIDQKRAIEGLPPSTVGPHDFNGFTDPQPEHIELAGQLGLGVWQLKSIDYKKFDITQGNKSK